jgi:nitroreductase
MKKHILFLGLFILGIVLLHAQNADNPSLKPIINHFAARNYSSERLSNTELELIVQAGLRAPSAGNRQPWYFTVVKDDALVKQLCPQATDGNVLIVISAAVDGTNNGSLFLDCGLAAQSIYLAAQALGLGSRIYTGPVENINKSFKDKLGLPDKYSVVVFVRIGKLPPGVDAVSSASPRNSAGQKVNYK